MRCKWRDTENRTVLTRVMWDGCGGEASWEGAQEHSWTGSGSDKTQEYITLQVKCVVALLYINRDKIVNQRFWESKQWTYIWKKDQINVCRKCMAVLKGWSEKCLRSALWDHFLGLLSVLQRVAIWTSGKCHTKRYLLWWQHVQRMTGQRKTDRETF